MNFAQVRTLAESENSWINDKDKEKIFVSGLPPGNLEKRIALRNCGQIDPEDIGRYILRAQGYSGFARALQMSPNEVIEELRKSGLRGRGGAGYSTAEKWKICHGTSGSKKYLVCNAIDADPLARTARLLLESDPHSILEGILIGAYAAGASHCFIALNTGYDLAIKRLRRALEQMRKYGLLGSHILDSTFDTEIEIKEVTASLVSGEETALLRSLEEKQAMPYLRPPYPATKGFADRPTLIDNVETLSDVSAILQKGAEWFYSIGTPQSKGSKVITLGGAVVHKYTVEVPFGTTLRSVIENIGGGVPSGKKIKAVQFGGPTGAYFAADSLDIQIDYEAVARAESVIGSGTIEVFDSDSCAVEMTLKKMAYLHDQSCGKCVFCREGCHQMSDILEDIAQSRGKSQDLDLLMELGEGMKLGSICGLGRNAPNPVLSSLKLFRGDYESHLRDKKCPLGK